MLPEGQLECLLAYNASRVPLVIPLLPANGQDMTFPDSLEMFLRTHSYSAKEWEDSGLSWDTLKAIAEDHARRIEDCATAGRAVREKLERCSAIHTIKMRVKSPESVAEKVLRKRLLAPDRDFSLATYRSEVTDLVGIRCLHLFKGQWEEIHKYVAQSFALKESPVMYHHRGDQVDTPHCDRLGVLPKVHGKGYRSVHYLLEVVPLKEPVNVEIQVRTQAEDLWSEVDHRARYSRTTEPPAHEAQALDLLNVFTAAADGLVSYVQQLRRVTAEMEARDAELRRMAEALTALESANLGKDKELSALRESLERMQKAPPSVTVPSLQRPLIGQTLGEMFETSARLSRGFSSGTLGGALVCVQCGRVDPGAAGASGRCTMCESAAVLTRPLIGR